MMAMVHGWAVLKPPGVHTSEGRGVVQAFIHPRGPGGAARRAPKLRRWRLGGARGGGC